MKKETKQKIADKARALGSEATQIVVTSVKLYLFLPLAGLIVGPGLAWLYAHFSDSGFWAAAGWVLLGLLTGPLFGLITAWLVASGLREDFVFKHGWEATKAGYGQLKKLWHKKP